MTFSELLLEARYYLHDTRKIDGTLITAVGEDGIRWTSTLLASVTKNALIEMARVLIAYKLGNNIAYNIQTRIVNCEILADNMYGLLNLSDGEIYNFYKVLKIQRENSSDIYDFIEDDKFFDMVWRNSNIDSAGAIDKKCFTSVYDTTAKQIKVLVLPNPESNITNCKAIVKYSLESIFTITSVEPLPFINSIDLAFDFIEKHAYAMQYAPQLVQMKNEVIKGKLDQMKLGEMKN